jgi:DNA-binding CsgD family transcriptional regulator
LSMAIGVADRVLGGLATLLGRPDDADRHFEMGVSLATRAGASAWLARTQLDWAQALAARGDSRAIGLLADARNLAAELGMASVLARCDDVVVRPSLTALDGAGAPRTEFPSGLSVREVEVLQLIARGCSNREIGERLMISGNTAANHVRAILQKTASANRAEAATFAARHQLLSDD